MCSNIECRAVTSGPADAPDKSVNIGEAAHIYGAKEHAARYRSDMTDVSRAEITNGIWLCRNCHKLVDADPLRFQAELLFQWRSQHERYVISKLGTPNDQLRFDMEAQKIDQFRDESPLARQIIRDRVDGWEYRLTAEFLRDHLKRTMRGWDDLQRNLYSRPAVVLASEDSIQWFRARIAEAGRLVPVLAALYTKELVHAWGEPGEPGDPVEIRHVCRLIQSAAEQLLQWEEAVRFASADDSYTKLFACLHGALGRQLVQLRSVPHMLDEIADWIDTHPGVAKSFRHELIFDLPEGWADRIDEEFDRIDRKWKWF